MWSRVVVVVLLAAGTTGAGCIGHVIDESGPVPDSGVIPPRRDGGASPGDDAAVVGPDCSQPGACPCFTSYDCPAGTYCHAESEMQVYCTPGARGTGGLGATCTGERDCKSALCVTPATG